MKDFEKCKFYGLERGHNSVYGNPSYYIYFSDAKEEFHRAKTASDSIVGYTAGCYYYAESGSPIYLQYHYTKGGKCIVDRIKHQHPEDAKKEEEYVL